MIFVVKDSEAEEHEETEEEFLSRYAKAAVSLEDGIDIDEGDLEDQDHEVELGKSLSLSLGWFMKKKEKAKLR